MFYLKQYKANLFYTSEYCRNSISCKVRNVVFFTFTYFLCFIISKSYFKLQIRVVLLVHYKNPKKCCVRLQKNK